MEEDSILGLPDGIIACIFSFLTIKEAARTSILSRRWRYLWAVFTHHLDFDVRVPLNLDLNEYVVTNHRDLATHIKYVKWVDHVLKSIQGPTIYELRIYHGYMIQWKDDIDRWVKYAIDKRVKRLELDFTCTHIAMAYRGMGVYPFPLQFCNSSFMRSLKDLSLTYVDASGQTLEYILSKCYSLEKLSITQSSPSLVNLKVSSQSLKFLHLIRCVHLEHLEVVDVVNLVSFTYDGLKQINCFIGNAPSLTELSFGHHGPSSNDIAVKLPLYLPTLETLKYHTGAIREGARNFPDNFPVKFNHLKHLELKIASLHLTPLRLKPLLKACPSLYRLKVEVATVVVEREVEEATKEDPYECLGVVELVASPASPDIAEFIFHLVENAENLKKIIINYWPTWVFHPQTNKFTDLDEQLARTRGMELIVPKLPPKIEFMML